MRAAVRASFAAAARPTREEDAMMAKLMRPLIDAMRREQAHEMDNLAALEREARAREAAARAVREAEEARLRAKEERRALKAAAKAEKKAAKAEKKAAYDAAVKQETDKIVAVAKRQQAAKAAAQAARARASGPAPEVRDALARLDALRKIEGELDGLWRHELPGLNGGPPRVVSKKHADPQVRAVKKCVNRLAKSMRDVADKSQKLRAVLDAFAAQGDRAFHYGCHIAASLVVEKGKGEGSAELTKSGEASFEVAYAVVALLSDPAFARRGEFMEHLRARFHAVCPQTCPGLKEALVMRARRPGAPGRCAHAMAASWPLVMKQAANGDLWKCGTCGHDNLKRDATCAGRGGQCAGAAPLWTCPKCGQGNRMGDAKCANRTGQGGQVCAREQPMVGAPCAHCKTTLKAMGYSFLSKTTSEGRTPERIEPQERYIGNMEKYIAFYAAVVQTDPVGAFLVYRGRPFPQGAGPGTRNPPVADFCGTLFFGSRAALRCHSYGTGPYSC